MMKCEEARSFVDAWENGDATTSRAAEEFRAHLESCPECSSRFGSLLPFMERDLGLAASAAPAPLPAGFADGVMSAIESRKRQGFVLSPSPRRGGRSYFRCGLGFGNFLHETEQRHGYRQLPSGRAAGEVGLSRRRFQRLERRWLRAPPGSPRREMGNQDSPQEGQGLCL